MRTIRTKVYEFIELNEQAQQKAIEKFYDINIGYDWWESTYEDAERAGLKITGFDIDRASYCKGGFINDADFCALEIIKDHGKDCETYKTAATYLEDRNKLDIDEQEDELGELDSEFLESICEDYRIILSKEFDYLTSKEAIIETIKVNSYEFKVDGTIF